MQNSWKRKEYLGVGLESKVFVEPSLVCECLKVVEFVSKSQGWINK